MSVTDLHLALIRSSLEEPYSDAVSESEQQFRRIVESKAKLREALRKELDEDSDDQRDEDPS